MSFLNTFFLWGLPLIAAPILIHLFNRRQKKTIHWSAMRFLQNAAARRKRLWRVSDLLLMLLRVAAVVLIVLALAQPMLSLGWTGAQGPRDIIMMLDTSLSTSRKVERSRMLDREIAEARKLVDGLKESDTLRVMLASSAPDWIVPAGRAATSQMRREVAGLLAGVQPTQGGVDLLSCVTQALETDPADRRAERIVVLITDGQEHGWRAETPDLWRAVNEKLKLADVPTTVNVVRVDHNLKPEPNLAVTAIESPRTLLGVGDILELTATVRNCGESPSAATTLIWSLGNAQSGVSSVSSLPPGDQVRLNYKQAIDQPGVQEVLCKLDRADALDADNESRLVVQTVEDIPILVVDGAANGPLQGNQALRGEAGFLLAALGRVGDPGADQWRSVFHPKVVAPAEVANETLENYKAIVFANADPLAIKNPGRLAAFAQEGGGLWIAFGDKLEPQKFNSMLASEGGALFPMKLDAPEGDLADERQFVSVRPPLAPHPATRLLTDTQRLDLDRVHVRRRHKFQAGHQAGAQVDDFATLLATDKGDPLAVEYMLGRGRVIVQTIPFSRSWSNLPISQVWVVMAQEWLWRVIEPNTTRWNLQPGEPLETALPHSEAEGQVIVPSGESETVTALERNGGSRFTFNRTQAPGRYELKAKVEGADRSLPFNVWRDPAESEIKGLRDDSIMAITLAGGLHDVKDPLASDRANATAPIKEPAWGWLLKALVGVLLIESLLAAVLTRRRNDRTPGLASRLDGVAETTLQRPRINRTGG